MELYLELERTREIARSDGRPKDLLAGSSEGAAVRVFRNGRFGFASGTDVSPDGVARLWTMAVAAAGITPPDPARRPPAPSRARSRERSYGVDSLLFASSASSLQHRLAALEKKLLRSDRRVARALSLSFQESRGGYAVVSTTGVAAAEPFGSVSFGLELLGESQGETQVSWASAESTRWSRLNEEMTAASARRRLLDSFGAAPLRSGAWPVVFDSRVGVDFLEFLSQAVAADAVQRGRSCLKSRGGQPVASERVTVVDDGRWKGGLGAGLWDAEGVPTRRTTVIGDGVFRSCLYDTETAAREGRESTGNAVRAGVSDPPSPGATNFYLAPGPVSAARLLAETPRAFIVRDVIGMHTADPVSGDFSVGAAGVLWENGKVRRAVKSVTLAGNLLDLLAKVDAVADDLFWQGAFGAPAFRVKELSVGGS